MYPRKFLGWIGDKIANSSDGRHELTERSAVHQAQQMLSGWPEAVRNLLLHPRQSVFVAIRLVSSSTTHSAATIPVISREPRRGRQCAAKGFALAYSERRASPQAKRPA
jgi:hypothetical protein